MQQLFRLARGLSSPAILVALVWCAALIGVAIGPVDYPMQPTPVVLAVVAAGVSLFILSYWAGAWSFDAWSKRRASVPAPSVRVLNRVVVATSLVGVVGIGLMAFDRLLLSGISNSGYAELLRCAPSLVDFIEIKRTPLLYAGYLTFSFGFVAGWCRPVDPNLRGQWQSFWRSPDEAVGVRLVSGIEHHLTASEGVLGLPEMNYGRR